MSRPKGGVVPPHAKVRHATVRRKLDYARDEELRVFGLLLLIGRPVAEAFQTIFGLRPNEAKYAWDRLLATGRLSQVMSETMEDIWKRAGVKIEHLIKMGMAMAKDEQTPPFVRAHLILRMSEQYYERAGVGKENRQLPIGMIPLGVMDPRVSAELQQRAVEAKLLPPQESAGGDGRTVKLGEGVSASVSLSDAEVPQNRPEGEDYAGHS